MKRTMTGLLCSTVLVLIASTGAQAVETVESCESKKARYSMQNLDCSQPAVNTRNARERARFQGMAERRARHEREEEAREAWRNSPEGMAAQAKEGEIQAKKEEQQAIRLTTMTHTCNAEFGIMRELSELTRAGPLHAKMTELVSFRKLRLELRIRCPHDAG